MPTRADPDERRKEILDAAMRCFARKGYHRTTMDEIVAESGLSKGTLYWYFDNKKALFIALFDKLLSEMTEPMLGLLEAPGSASERLRMLGIGTGQMFTSSEELNALPVNFMLEAWLDEDISQHYGKVIQEFADLVIALLREGIDGGEFREIDVVEVAWGMMASLEGIILYHLVGMPVPGNVGKQIAVMTDVIIEGLRKKGAP